MKDQALPGFESIARVQRVAADSPTRRRTARRRALLEAGIHPLHGGHVRRDGATCGNCGHLSVHFFTQRFFKCGLHNGGSPSSEATDVRKSWPGCGAWTPNQP